MADNLSYVGLIVSMLLPLFVGVACTYRLLSRTGAWNWPVVIGHGYLAGVFIMTLLIRVWDLAGLALNFWPMAAALTILGLAGLATNFIGSETSGRVREPAPDIANWQKLLIWTLLSLILWRYWTLLQEILERPLFSWDSWMNWVPKAIVWFEHGELTDFISTQDWLQQGENSRAYTLGAARAWMYPQTIPLITLWGALGIDTVDHNLIYLPWLMVPIALGAALYGHLRLNSVSPLLALIGCYMLLNMPYFNVHTALPGYADIWMASALGCAVFALHQWHIDRQPAYALLALFFALMCTQLKIPGLILAAIVLVVFLFTIISFGRRASMICFGATIIAGLYLAFIGVDFSLPGLGRVAVSAQGVTLPYIGEYEFNYHPVSEPILRTTLTMLNWNLLWYVFIGIALIKSVRGEFLNPPSPALATLLLSFAFIFFVYYLTDRYRFAVDYTQVNRALIYTTPSIIFYLSLYLVGGNRIIGAHANRDNVFQSLSRK